MTAPVRVLLAGLGDFGERHAAAVAANPGAELVAVVGRDPGRTAAFAERHGVAGWSVDLEEALRDHRPDAVIIAAPGALHLPMTRAALAAGASVLLEKPVVPTIAEIDELRRAAEAAPGFVMPAHVLRFSAPYRELRRRLQEGRIGTPVSFAFRRYRARDHDRRFPDVHPAYMTAIHDIDLAIWLSGQRFSELSATSTRVEGAAQPGSVMAHARGDRGAVCSFAVSWLLPDGVAEDALEVFGTEGMLALDHRYVLRERSDAGEGETEFPDYDLDVALQEEVDHFVACVARGEASDVITLEEALHGLELAEAMAQGGRA